ncbi:MAG TPA: flagellar biosynthetic protein FliR, partial [Burkholderiaceae bacterium]|nr:flagellar biosynthetic protein FliR [Burkholderiaceae bacterium]
MQVTELTAIEGMFAPVALTLPRLLAVFAIAPFFSGNLINGLTRNGLVLMLAIFISPVAGEMPALALGTWVLIAAKEAL